MELFNVREEDRYAVLEVLVPKLDGLVAPKIKAELVLLSGKGYSNIILDLSHTKYIDSSGLSALLIGDRQCRQSNGLFVVTGVSDFAKKLIQISQLEKILTLIPTISEAIEYIIMDDIAKNNGI